MSNLNQTNAGVILLMSTTSISFSLFHAYKFDRCKCLLPRRKEWFRVLLTWMLLGCNIGMFIWGAGWSWVKYDVGWIIYPDPYGALPVQPDYFPHKYKRLEIPLSTAMNLGYSLQTSLNAEEGLYWFHLMRAVRQPKSARSWLNSYFCYAWVAITIISTCVQCSVGWITQGHDYNTRLARELTCGAFLEMGVLIAASVVVFKFPAFLRDVKASGAGPEVRSRLHFYHEANKVRTFFRLIFTLNLLTLGIDGLREVPVVNMNHIGNDIVTQCAIASFFIVLMISMMLYLPRSYSSAPKGQVMVAQAQPRRPVNPLTSGHALMSLLREGGQWDDDDDHRARLTQTDGNVLEVPVPKTWSIGSGNRAAEEKWTPEGLPVLPSVLENFTSPIAVSQPEVSPGPIRIIVQREIERDE